MSSQAGQARKRPPRRWRISPVWLVPLAAVLIGLWLAYRTLSSLGAEIVLKLDTAEGLEAGRTAVKLNNVDVGVVRDVSLTENYENVVATIRMEPEVGPLLVDDTEFWVVKPRVSRQGISGLQTIISGAYIQMRPGESETSARRFTALDQPPTARSDVPGISLVLTSKDEETLATGDPVFYQGRSVGQVTSANFDLDARQTRYIIVIEAPYDKLITGDTQFWLRSGIDAQLTSEGLNLELGTLQTLLTGGVTFGTQPGGSAEPASDGDEFQLFRSREVAEQARFDIRIEYLVLFDDSVRGLHAGAPVELRGVRVGTVSRVPFFDEDLQPDSLNNPRIPVLISFEPQRLGEAWSGISREEWIQRLEQQFDKGLRASISPGNLLTGATYVDLTFEPEAGPVAAGERAGYPVFPAHPGGGLSGLENKVSALLDKLNALRINPVLNQLETTLGGTDRTLRDTRDALRQIQRLFESDTTRALPDELGTTLQELQSTIAAYQEGQPVHDALLRALKRLNQVLDELAPFVEDLRERPNALIFGPEQRRDPVPRADP